ncbi:MAG: hypothetical protein R3C28_07345 [Pirellulaceae bacterium]
MTSRCRFVISWLVAATLCAASVQANDASPTTAKVNTYQDANGTQFFALSLQPHGALSPAMARDVLVLMDTSASQVGAYRTDGTDALKSIMRSLGSEDRICVTAIDLDVVKLTDGFVSAKNAVGALKKLSARTPLGSTDLVRGMQVASEVFSRDAQVARQVVYIGDGVSRADLFSSEQFDAISNQLAAQRISFFAYAIGPDRDLGLMVSLANLTGGHVFIDAADVTGQQAGQAVAQALTSPVVWVTSELPSDLAAYPANMPPLRMDRDTGVVGMATSLPASLDLSGEINGQAIQLHWNVDAVTPNDDFAFLPKLIDLAKADQGKSLPLMGTDSLASIRRMMLQQADHLAKIGQQAFASGNVQGAKILADEAAETRSNQHCGGSVAKDHCSQQRRTSGRNAGTEGSRPI